MPARPSRGGLAAPGAAGHAEPVAPAFVFAWTEFVSSGGLLSHFAASGGIEHGLQNN